MSKTKRIAFAAMGVALYVAMSYAIQVPVFENYYICLGYTVMLVWCYLFGPIMGAAAGGMGCILYCLLTSGLRGMPGWTLGNIVIAVNMGLTFKITRSMHQEKIRIGTVLEIMAIVISTTLGILIVKSFTEVVLYSQPMLVRMAKNVYASIADTVVLIISLPICRVLDAALRRILPEQPNKPPYVKPPEN